MTIPPEIIAVIASIAILGITIYISARLELRRMKRGVSQMNKAPKQVAFRDNKHQPDKDARYKLMRF